MDVRGLDRSINEHYNLLYRGALVLTGNRHDAEDLVQGTFLRAFTSSFAGRSRPQTWLYSILLNLHRRMRSTQARRWQRWITWLSRQPARRTPGPGDLLLAQEWQESLWKIVSELPESLRDVIVLRYAEELSYNDIAEVLECPIGTVKSRIHRALLTLKDRVEDNRTEQSSENRSGELPRRNRSNLEPESFDAEAEHLAASPHPRRGSPR